MAGGLNRMSNPCWKFAGLKPVIKQILGGREADVEAIATALKCHSVGSVINIIS